MFASLFFTTGLWASYVLDLAYAAKVIRSVSPRFRLSPRVWLPLLAFLTLAGYGHGCTTLLTPAHIYAINFLSARAIAFLLTAGVAHYVAKQLARRPGIGLKDLLTGLRANREARRRFIRRAALKFAVTLVLVVLVLTVPVGVPLIGRAVDYARATYMRGAFRAMAVGDASLFPEIDPSQLRVTTSAIARSIAEMKKTSAASWVTSVHLGFYEGELCWIATVSEPPMFGSMLVGSSNRLREVIVVPVTDATGERARVAPLDAAYGEGLWFDRDIRVHAQDLFPTRTFSRAYLTWSPEHKRLVYVTTSYYEVPFGPLKDPMVHVWDPRTGALLASYRPEEAPDWIIQRWDERWLELAGSAFGEFRWTAENDLNFWNGLPYCSDRSAEPAEPEGLRYQMWPNGELVGVYLFRNKRNPSLLEFAIIARRGGVYLYSLDHLALISPDEAKRVAKAGLPALPSGSYATPLALLYRIGDELYYHIPIFIYQEGHYTPAYFALVRATDRWCVRVSCAEVGGLREAISAAYAQVGHKPVEHVQISGTLIGRYEYVENGNTRIWLEIKLENGTVVHALAKVELLEPEDVYLLLSKELGDPITVLVDTDMVVVDVLKVSDTPPCLHNLPSPLPLRPFHATSANLLPPHEPILPSRQGPPSHTPRGPACGSRL